MKSKKLKIGQVLDLIQIIRSLNEGKDGEAKIKLPFRFNYAIQRTAKKLQEAAEPIQEKIDEIWKPWHDTDKPAFDSKLEKAKGKAKEKLKNEIEEAFKALNEKWIALRKETIESEVYDFPVFTEKEFNVLDEAAFTPGDLDLFIDVMNLRLDEAS